MKSFASLLVVPLIMLACGGDDDEASDSSAFVEAYCRELTPCCGAGENGKTPGSGCTQIYGTMGFVADYDAAKGSACLNEVKAGKADAAFCTKVAQLAPSCDGVFKIRSSSNGTKQPGEECETETECAPSAEGEVKCAFKSIEGDALKQACQIEVIGKVGDTCQGVRTANGGSLKNSNEAPPKVTLCDLATSYCSRTTQKCEPVKTVGADCTGTDTYECGLPTGSRCDYATKKCIALKNDGDACKSSSECKSSQCSAGTCKALGSSSGTDPSLLLVCATTSNDG
jgi:hypothetical protein